MSEVDAASTASDWLTILQLSLDCGIFGANGCTENHSMPFFGAENLRRS